MAIAYHRLLKQMVRSAILCCLSWSCPYPAALIIGLILPSLNPQGEMVRAASDDRSLFIGKRARSHSIICSKIKFPSMSLDKIEPHTT